MKGIIIIGKVVRIVNCIVYFFIFFCYISFVGCNGLFVKLFVRFGLWCWVVLWCELLWCFFLRYIVKVKIRVIDDVCYILYEGVKYIEWRVYYIIVFFEENSFVMLFVLVVLRKFVNNWVYFISCVEVV